MSISSDAIRGYIDLIVLGLLNEQDRYGYEIAKEISNRSNNVYEIHEASLYSAFRRLKTHDFIEPYYSVKESSNRKRKYFKITTKGTEHLKEKYNEWTFTKTFIDLFLTGVDGNV